MVTVPARVQAFINEANERAPGRRTSSDGTYVNKPGDHNVDWRGINHAGDLSESMPGTPYWEPQFEQFDVHAWQRRIAGQYVAASVTVRSQRWPWLFDGGYMHGYDYALKVDVIFHPAVSLTWRVDNSPPSEHIQHGHFSIGHTVRSENDTQAIFVGATQEEPPVTDAEIAKVVAGVVKKLGRQADGTPGLIGDEVTHVLGGYNAAGVWVDGLLAAEARKKLGLSK